MAGGDSPLLIHHCGFASAEIHNLSSSRLLCRAKKPPVAEIGKLEQYSLNTINIFTKENNFNDLALNYDHGECGDYSAL